MKTGTRKRSLALIFDAVCLDLLSKMKSGLLIYLAMEVFKLTTTINESGYLNLNIPTELAAVEVNIVIVLNPVSSDGKRQHSYDFSDLVGRLNWRGDTVAMQRTLRDEW